MAISKFNKKFEYGKVLTESDLNGMVDAINVGIDGVNNADKKADTAISTANTAKNAVAKLEGLNNATDAAETLAGLVVQIEENKTKSAEALSLSKNNQSLINTLADVEPTKGKPNYYTMGDQNYVSSGAVTSLITLETIPWDFTVKDFTIKGSITGNPLAELRLYAGVDGNRNQTQTISVSDLANGVKIYQNFTTTNNTLQVCILWQRNTDSLSQGDVVSLVNLTITKDSDTEIKGTATIKDSTKFPRLDEKIKELEDNATKINYEEAEDEEEEVIFSSDQGNVFASINKKGVKANNFLDKNGNNINILAIEDEEDLAEEQVWVTDSNEVVASVGEYGFKAKQFLDLEGNPLTTIRFFRNDKYVAIGDSITYGIIGNTGTSREGTEYPYIISELLGLIWNREESKANTNGYILISNGTESRHYTEKEISDNGITLTPIFSNTYSQNKYQVYFQDGNGNYYKKCYQMSLPGMSLYGDVRNAIYNSKWLNPNIITIMCGQNDIAGVMSTANPYKVGEPTDIPVGLYSYYILSETSASNDFMTKIPSSSRKVGMVVNFLNENNAISEYFYIGVDTNDDNWNNSENWKPWYTLTFCSFLNGCLARVSIDTPSAKLYVCNLLKNIQSYNASTKETADAIANATVECCKNYNIRYIDCFNSMGINEYNYGVLYDNESTVHPSVYGYSAIGNFIAKQLNSK